MNFEAPQLYTTRANELPLSGQALLDLMSAVLSKGVPFRFKARGWSMAPFIQDGDVITIAPVENKKPGVGDVVAFTRPDSGNLVVHRIVAKRQNHVLIVGDSIPEHPDGAIPLNNLLGQVTCIRRAQKRIWLGLGPERFLIAWLSRADLLLLLRKRFATCRNHFSIKDK